MNSVGIDLHRSRSHVAVIDEHGELSLSRRIANDSDVLLELLAGLEGETRIAVVGYLIAPVTYVPLIAAEVAVKDNIIFNVSPTIGDHVMCSDIRLSLGIGFAGSAPAVCAPWRKC